MLEFESLLLSTQSVIFLSLNFSCVVSWGLSSLVARACLMFDCGLGVLVFLDER
jgi:hypothetical protein